MEIIQDKNKTNDNSINTVNTTNLDSNLFPRNDSLTDIEQTEQTTTNNRKTGHSTLTIPPAYTTITP